jgi:hypothetical protein
VQVQRVTPGATRAGAARGLDPGPRPGRLRRSLVEGPAADG